MKTLIRNWRLIHKIAKLYKIPVQYGIQVDEAHIAHRRRKVVHIQIPFIPTNKVVIMFFHELGHAVHPLGLTHPDTIQREFHAWEAAFELMSAYKIKLEVIDYSRIVRWFGSYAVTHPPTFHTNMSNISQAFQRKYIDLL